MPQESSPFVSLAASWAQAGVPPPALVDRTREALATVQPQDLAGLAGLVETLVGRAQQAPSREGARRALFTLLDAVRRRFFTEALAPGDIGPWVRLLIQAIDRGDYTFGDMLRSREETDPRAPALRVLGAEACELTVADVARRTRAIARGLLAQLKGEPEARVAILAENALETALCDLACLSNGIVSFPLPANALAEHVVYMLRHSEAQLLLVSDEEQLAKVLPSLGSLPRLRAVVVFSRASADRHGLLSLEQMVGQGGGAFDDAERAARAAAVRSRDLATVMYTSGTTGAPKGITFNHLNIVSKRLCRGFALPSLGDGDVFLAYLPLYHTFGRFFEMTGALWWGATYVFARSTAHASLLEDFRAVRPTVFISVPKKWLELQEEAARAADEDQPDEIAGHLKAITGGRLQLGLSAAGYLDSLVFRSFHRAGVELCSGYGMTEATGGVLMTPVGEYVDDSVGKPLPGIECRIAEDGELLLRGPYVSPGYFHPSEEEAAAHDAEGWFHTGDLFAADERGHYRITGRKKELYKNRMGQTIAPQRVENLFRDFDAVGQAFLVGDHREYNTLLIWPDYQGQPALAQRPPEELGELLSSLVASANRFLAPFERVVSFQVLPRALDEEHGELTAKHTFKREVVERNWKDLIDRMYVQKHLALAAEGGFTLRIPNWVLREMGILQHELTLRDGCLQARGQSIAVGPDRAAPGALRIGDLAYAAEGSTVDLGAVLASPSLWLGNEGLKAFVGQEAFRSLASRRRKGGAVRLDTRMWSPPDPSRLPRLLEIVDREEVDLDSIHAAGEVLRAERPEARRAIIHLQLGLAAGRREHAALCRALLRRAADAPDEEIRRLALRVLLPEEEVEEVLPTLRTFLDRLGPMALRDEDLAVLGERGLPDAQAQALLSHLSSEAAWEAVEVSDRRLLVGAMRLLAAFAVAHPRWYPRVRVPLARLSLHADQEIAARAQEEHDRLRRGFTNWIGPNLRLAIDPDNGEEYGWKEVVAFEHGIPGATRALFLRALADTTLVRASVFLFGEGALISLADLAPGGASVSHLGTRLGKSVYRLSLHTRSRETYDVAVNLVESMHPAELREEITWLLACGAPPPLVEAFGGYYPEYGIFSEEFIPGEHVARQVARLDRQGERTRLRHVWSFLAWTALDAHVAFWDRTGRRLALRDPSPEAFIVPSHDYHAGARLVSISDRSPCETFDELLDRFQASFLEVVEGAHPELRGEVTDAILLSSAVEALGLERARRLLESVRGGKRGAAVEAFLAWLAAEGYAPQRIHFAVRRYHRWLSVNPAATLEARGKMLAELWGTYRLVETEQEWPDSRIRFFRRTVFAEARPELAEALDRLMARARALPPGGIDLEEHVAALRFSARPTREEDYFLARLTYRYLAPEDDVALISLSAGARQVTEPVLALADEGGARFFVRGPANPREVARLLQIFHESQLPVSFSGEHEFLLAFDARETVVGGVYYRMRGPERAHMEKIAVGRKVRGKGVSDGIMRELARRLRSRGVRSLETGYYQPEYLKRYGFRTDPASGGLILDLDAESLLTR
jgi:long-subunit acyl-CoA synthetase (AMP-forming)